MYVVAQDKKVSVRYLFVGTHFSVSQPKPANDQMNDQMCDPLRPWPDQFALDWCSISVPFFLKIPVRTWGLENLRQ